MIKYYLHVPELAGWQVMFAEVLEKMESSGLLEKADEINFCFNGVKSTGQLVFQPLVDANPKFKYVHVNGDGAKWEWPTLNQIKLDADADDEVHYVGYGHLKGLSRPDKTDQKAIDWRDYLVYWGIERWEDSITKLEEGYELSSVNWMTYPWVHFSGNFWWANTNYIRRLQKLQDPSTIVPGQVSEYLTNIVLDPGNVRYECEAWPASGKPNQYELHASHPKGDTSFHYNNTYPPSKYREV